MKTFFYSLKDFEEPYLYSANINKYVTGETPEALSLKTVALAKDYETISIFTGDDASAPVLEKLYKQGVRYIAVRAAGYDNVDIQKANELGLTVANVPRYSPYAIAEHAVAMMLALNRKILLANKQVHEHDFRVGRLIGSDFNNRVVGIIGTGKIGAVLAKIMHGFGCQLLGYDINPDSDLVANYGMEYVDLPRLCRESDMISIHIPLRSETRHLIDAGLINQMKKQVILINTSRGACVNTTDVIEALENKRIGYYGADVYENEKGVFFYDWSGRELADETLKKLLTMPNVLITPHQGFATEQALDNIAVTTFYNLRCWAMDSRSKNELTFSGIALSAETK